MTVGWPQLRRSAHISAANPRYWYWRPGDQRGGIPGSPGNSVQLHSSDAKGSLSVLPRWACRAILSAGVRLTVQPGQWNRRGRSWVRTPARLGIRPCRYLQNGISRWLSRLLSIGSARFVCNKIARMDD